MNNDDRWYTKALILRCLRQISRDLREPGLSIAIDVDVDHLLGNQRGSV